MQKTIIALLMLLFVGCSAGEPSAVFLDEPDPPSDTATPLATEVPTSTPTQVPTPKPTVAPVCVSFNGTADPEELFWWNEAVFYEIFVRSFYDSDGDGIGDFNGLVEKLDYLNDGDPNTDTDLGITGIWLMPINVSPSYHGYDVVDYYSVNPEYGTMEEFESLLDEAHQRGIRVIIDLVINHTSTKHPWFEDASSNLESVYRDYYIFADSPGGYKSPWGSPVWHRADTGFYYGVFWSGMPDLNYENPAVEDEMADVARYWLDDVGVDGFRLDAIKHIIEDGAIQENTPETHAFWERFFDSYTDVKPDALTVGEAWTSTGEVLKYIGDEVNIAFEFDTAGAMIASARDEKKRQINQAHELVIDSYPAHQYATFLSNHDQPRVMTELRGNVDRAKNAASLLLTGPGVPFMYYGEEVGQHGSRPDENLRAPMQWSGDANAGFTSANLPWRMPQRGYEEANVENETSDPGSLLSHYRNLIHFRNQTPALQTGEMQLLPGNEQGVYAFLRYLGGDIYLVVINLTGREIDDYRFCLTNGPLEEGRAVDVFQNSPVVAPILNNSGGFDAYRPIDLLAPYSTYIIQLE